MRFECESDEVVKLFTCAKPQNWDKVTLRALYLPNFLFISVGSANIWIRKLCADYFSTQLATIVHKLVDMVYIALFIKALL